MKIKVSVPFIYATVSIHMDGRKVKEFIYLAGQSSSEGFVTGDPKKRALGAQLLLSEVLEYVIKGLGVIPSINGTPITEPESLHYDPCNEPDKLDMVDGLADTAYTMYWNAITFGIPLESAYDLVCDNNLEKFVLLSEWKQGEKEIPQSEWALQQGIVWPPEVVSVSSIKVGAHFYAVGKDKNGKVRKPSSYSQVDLSQFV